MANNVTAIQDLQNEVLKLENRFQEVNTTILDISQNLRTVGASISNIKFSSDVGEQSRASTEQIERLNQALQDQTKTIATLEARLTQLSQVRARGTRATSEEIVNNRVLRQNADNYARSISSLVGAYGNLSSQNNLLIREYQNLSVQQRLGNDLTQQQVSRLEQLSSTITRNQQILKQTDAEVGRFQRNVGNYSSAFDGLGNSLNNITREFPAFAVSAQTGILAISNNIPILFDEIGKIVAQNRELIAQGKETTSVFRRLGTALFSLSSILSIGVAVFTIYGKEIANFISGLIGAATQADAATNATNQLNQAYVEGAKQISNQVAQNQLYLTVAADVTRSEQERNGAVDRLIESNKGLITEQDRLNILNGDAARIESQLTRTLLNRATVQAVLQATQEDFAKIVENNIRLQRTQEERARVLSNVDRQALRQLRDGIELENVRIRVRTAEGETIRELTELERENVLAVRESIRAGEAESVNNRRANQLDQFSGEIRAENAVIQERINALIRASADLIDEDTLALEGNTVARQNRQRVLALELETTEERAERAQELARETAQLFEELFNVDDAIQIPELDQTSIQEVQNRLAQAIIDQQLADDIAANLDRALGGLSESISRSTGISQRVLNDFFNNIRRNGFTTFEDIASFATSAFDVITDLGRSITEGRLQALEQEREENNLYYEELLANEELTESERARLEADREQREDEIRQRQRQEQIRQARFEKAFNIASIIANTAVGVSKALAQGGFILGIPQAAVIAGIGAVQLAAAIAQPIPQFEKGKTAGNNYEGPAIWGEKRQEVKLSKDGTIEVSPKKIANHLTHVKKDDIIFPNMGAAEKYISGLSDEELASDLNKHTFLANMQRNNSIGSDYMNLQALLASNRRDTREIVQAIRQNKPNLRVNNNISLAKDLKFMKRAKNIL